MAGHRRRRAEQQRQTRQKTVKQLERAHNARPKGFKRKGFSHRSGLRPFCGEFHTFRARFVKRGQDFSGSPTYLVCDVVHCESGERVADHLWLKSLAQLSHRTLKKDALLELFACPESYWKGCKNDAANPLRRDYSLGEVSDARVVKRTRPVFIEAEMESADSEWHQHAAPLV